MYKPAILNGICETKVVSEIEEESREGEREREERGERGERERRARGEERKGGKGEGEGEWEGDRRSREEQGSRGVGGRREGGGERGRPQELPWRSFQAAFLPGRDAAQAVFQVQRCCEMSNSGVIFFSAQLDLKKEFHKARHSAISDALLAKGVPVHRVAILNSLWSQRSMLFMLAHLRAARDVKAHRGVSQGAPESPRSDLQVVCSESGVVVRHLPMTCVAYEDDVLLFADSLESLIHMFNDCCASFERAGLVVGAEKHIGVLLLC